MARKKSFFSRIFGPKTAVKQKEARLVEKPNPTTPQNSIQQNKNRLTNLPKQMPKEQQNTNPAPAKETETKEGNWTPEYEGQLAIDVYQTDSDIVIKSTIAGVNPEDIDVTIDNDMVTIRGERKNDVQVAEENYYYQECYWGSFSRSVILPCDIETDKASAELKNGILTIYLPKVNKSRTKKVTVKAV